MFRNFTLFPPEASVGARQVDHLYYYLLSVAGFFTLLIAVLIVVFAVRYRRSRMGESPPQISGALWLEITWSVIPLGLTVAMFVWGARIYISNHVPPEDALEIHVVGKQWMWKIQHPTGNHEINTLHVPTGRPVKLVMVSQDVIHSFYVPAFRVKQDVLPNRYTSLWFQATQPGTYHLFCAEYCGTDHSRMGGSVIVMSPSDYGKWLTGGVSDQTPEQAGEALFGRLACNTCHRSDGTGRGPALTGLFGSRVVLSNGRTVPADDTYLRESILHPAEKIVAGYQPVMPENYPSLVSEEDVFNLIAYIKSLAPQTETPQ